MLELASAAHPSQSSHRVPLVGSWPRKNQTIASKGQTTIPKEIRDSLSLKAGDRMTFTLMPDATVVMRVKSKSVTELAGVLHEKGRKHVSVAQLSR